jgi:hypothetical protein
MRARTVVLLFGLSLVAAALQAASQARADVPMTVAPSAARVLNGARAYLGGAAALRSVRSLDVRGKRTRLPPDGVEGAVPETDPFAFRLLLPDRFQRVTSTVVHTLAGGRFWQKPPFGPDVTATARRNITYDFEYTSAMYLLQPALLQVAVTDVGVQQVGSKQGRVLRYRGPDFDVRLVVDERSFQPLAVLRTSVVEHANGGGEYLNVRALLDYRRVGDIMIPFRSEETVGTFRSITILDAVRLNTLTPADFTER